MSLGEAAGNARTSGSRAVARLLLTLCGLLLTFGAAANAAGPLRLELRALAAQPRPGAPEWIEVRLDSSSVQLVEGVLELRVLDDSALAFTQQTQELALTTGARVFRLLLPPPRSTGSAMEREVRARFLTRTGELDLGAHALRSRLGGGQSFVLGIARPQLHRGEAAARLWQSLRPERFAPGAAPRLLTETISTSPVILEPEELPTDPLVFCAFDALLLEPGAFVALKEKQLIALGQWLAAGGSVAIVTDDVLDVGHLELLRSWMKADPAALAHEIDAESRVRTKDSAPILARVGLGRLAIFPRVPETDVELDTPEWRRAAAFLWKFRTDHVLAIEQEGHWNTPPPSKEPWRNSAHERTQLIHELTEKLLPKSVRVIPLPVIVAILAAFIITVGPLDYFVLGKLRRRRLTWILFPVVSVAFTGLTVKLASHYLGTNTHRGAFILTDLGPDGRIVRETRLELTLPARPQELTRETQHALTAVIGNADYRGEQGGGPTVVGQFPARFTFRGPMQQWTPHLLRLTSFATREDDSRVNWDAFTGDTIVHGAIVEGVRGASIPIVAPTGSAHLAAADAMRGKSGCTFGFSSRGALIVDAPGELSGETLDRLTLTRDYGIFPVVAQLSPVAGSTLDDLVMREPSDTRTIVVIAMRREGADLRAWRRLYLLP